METNLDSVAPEESLTVRERLAIHRENPSCNGCHGLMDPLGFALENFDVDGTWRDVDRESGRPIDASGLLPDGSKIGGPEELREALLARPEQFVQTFVEKLLAYALGRSTEWYDMPAVREVVRRSAADDYRFSAVVMGIVQSAPFTTRDVGEGEPARAVGSRALPASDLATQRRLIGRRRVVFLTKKRISRRAVLRGAGASIALPLLDAMIPAGVALAQTVVKPRTRMGFFYFPHGAFTGKWTEINSWTPAGEGRNFEISQVLKPLEQFRDRMTVISGLRNRGQEDKAGGVHKSSEQAWLKGVEVRDGAERGNVDRSDRRARDRAATPRSRASSSRRSPICTSEGTRFERPTRCCRWSTTRASSSTDCSGPVTRCASAPRFSRAPAAFSTVSRRRRSGFSKPSARRTGAAWTTI